MDLLLDSQGDLDISTGDLQLTTGGEAIAQHLRIRLQFFLGEWFLDSRIGIPFFQSILIKNPATNVVRSIFRAAILSTPGVISLSELTIDFDGPTRTLAVAFTAETEVTDEPLVFEQEFII